MKVSVFSLVACAAFLVGVGSLKADVISTASLSPAADGATNSNGSGSVTLDFNPMTDVFNYTLSWANLTGPATMAHIHYGPPGVAGPIIVPFFMSTMPGTDTITGTLTQADVTPAAGISTIAQVEQAIVAGNAYVNIHTAAYPAGELRGQLSASGTSTTPEPSTAGFLLTFVAGSAGVVFFRRRNQQVGR